MNKDNTLKLCKVKLTSMLLGEKNDVGASVKEIWSPSNYWVDFQKQSFFSSSQKQLH